MLKANDLRVGNWIAMLNETSTTEDTYYTWQIKTGSEIDTITEYLQSNTDPEIIAYKSIELNPEVLQQFGFKPGNKSDYFIEFENSIGDKKKLYIGYDEGSYFWGIEEDLKSVPVEKIHYLHQVQNIYFSLSGAELQPGE